MTSATFDIDALRAQCAAILVAVDVPDDSALLVADCLVDAEARGIGSHGVGRMRIYTERIVRGRVDPRAEPVVVLERTSTVQLDARNGPGPVGARAAVDLAVAKAAVSGVAVAGVANANHCGALGYFVRRATDAGMAAVAMANAPASMAVFGSRAAAVGTNPVALAVPREDGPAIVLDMATSAAAKGKIIAAARERRSIPDGWAITPGGAPTTDAALALAGAVLPVGGPKGSGLALVIDLLCGAMLGGPTGKGIGSLYDDWTSDQRLGQLFFVVDPRTFVGGQTLPAAADRMSAAVHELDPAPGFDQILAPGEVEERALRTAMSHGVALSEALMRDLQSLAESVEAPWTLDAGARA